jgi:2-polyprenyl-3-methyl-5-hydroxy-6-metoxy-1,4-benzoquinol methylase
MKNSVKTQISPVELNSVGIVDEYTRLSTSYEQSRLTPYMRLVEGIERDVIGEQVGELDVCAALEIGCGTGRFSEYLTRLGCRVHAIDITPAMLKLARAQRGGLSQITWLGASAERLPFADTCFDLVLALKVLPHVPDLSVAIDNIVRVMKHHGMAILEFYNPLSLGSLSRRYSILTQWHSPSRVEQMLEQAGLTIIKCRGARTVIPFGYVMSIPLFSSILARIEWALSRSMLCKLASYYIVVARLMDAQ